MTLADFMKNPHHAHLAWSYLSEGSDMEARSLVAAKGAVESLQWLEKVFITGQIDPNSPWKNAVQRWLPRFQNMDIQNLFHAHRRGGGTVVTPYSEHWPDSINDLQERVPFALWVRGNQEVLGQLGGAVAIVGARASSTEGNRVAAELAVGLAEAGRPVVSGGAFGIDAAAARGVLSVDGVTVAVMAGGVDRLYPASHVDLLQQVMKRGAVVSEAPYGARPTRWRFLDRNRIIAALSQVTVIVEAGHRSGALNTAAHAATIGREVAAVPGSIYSQMSVGCHRLIRDGAQLVTSAAQIIELVSPLSAVTAATQGALPISDSELGPAEKRVLDALPARRASDVATVTRVCGLAPAQVLAALGKLELQGRVRQDMGQWRRESIGA